MAIRSRPAGPSEFRPAGPDVRTELIGPPPLAQPPEPPEPERELWPWLVVLLLLVIAGLASVWYATRGSGGASSPAQTRLTTVAGVSPKTKAKPKPILRKRQITATVVQVTVPDLVGQRRADAVRSLEAQG